MLLAGTWKSCNGHTYAFAMQLDVRAEATAEGNPFGCSWRRRYKSQIKNDKVSFVGMTEHHGEWEAEAQGSVIATVK